jgi:hypothetical protein
MGLFFTVCGLSSLILCLMVLYTDMDEYDRGIVAAMKLIDNATDEFFKTYKGAEEADNYDLWNSNESDNVALCPPTWLLLLINCIQNEGNKIHEFLKRNNISQPGTVSHKVATLAHTRLSQMNAFVVIRGKAYSNWMLEHLYICPCDTVKPVSFS